MLKNLFSFVLIALVFFGNFLSTNADVQSSLPLVYVTEVNIERDNYKPEEILRGNIVLLSKNKEDANNLYLTFSLVDADKLGGSGFSTEVKKLENISIKADESSVIPFEFVLPKTGPKNLRLKVQASMSSGLPLGWEHSKNFNFESNSSYLTLVATRLSLDNGVTFPTDYGPHIYKDKKPSSIAVEALLKNTLPSDITVVPEIVVYKWPKAENAETAKSRVGQSVVVKNATGDVTISVPLPNFDYDPGVYEGVLYIKDEKGELKVSEISFRYIVSGELITIHSLSTAKNELAEEEPFEVKVFVTGTPPDLDNGTLEDLNASQNVSVELNVFNEKNALVATEKKELSLKAENDISFSLVSKKESKFLRGEVIVRKDGKEIKRYSSNFSADYTESTKSESFFDKYFIYIVSVIVIFVLYLAYIFIFKKSLTGKAFVFAVLLSLGAFSYTKAFTHEARIGYSTSFGDIIQEIFVNRPIEDQTLRYGESFNIEGNFFYPYCSNSAGDNSTVSTWIAKGDGSVLDLNSDGLPDYKHVGITSLGNGASASNLVGCDNPRHCWFKPSKTFIDQSAYPISSVIPYGGYRAYVEIVTTFTTGPFRLTPLTSRGYTKFSVIPSSPKSVTAETSSCGKKIKLSWAPVPGVSGYNVYRATTLTGAYNFVTNVSTTTYTNTTPNPNTRYFYKITAYHSASLTNSGISNSVAVSATSSAVCLLGVCKSYPDPVAIMPTGLGLCDFGVSSPVVSNLNSYDWTCLGEPPTIPVMCSATKTAPGTCAPTRIYNVDKCCPVALVAGTCPPPPSAPNISGVSYCTPPSATSTTIRLSVNSPVGSLPIYHSIQSVSATSSFRAFVWTLTQTTSSHMPYFDVTGLATSTYARYAVTSYNAVGQSSSTLMMYPVKTPPICPICPDGITPKPLSGVCPIISLENNACAFVKDDPTDPDTPRVNRWFSQVAHAIGTNAPFTLTWSGDVPAADFSISNTASTSKLRTRYDTPGLKNLNMRIRDSAGNIINRSCNITVYCPDGTLNCAGGLVPSISRIDNSCLFPTTKNTIYFNSNSTIFPVNYKVYRKKTGDPDTSYVKLGSSPYTYIQNSIQDAPVFVDEGLPMSQSYTYRVWGANAYNFNVYSTAVASTTGFCSGTICPDGTSALADGSCQVFSQPFGELSFDELYVWPPRVTHGESCKIYIRKVTGESRKLFATVPPTGASCTMLGPVGSSFPEDIDPSSFNTKDLFTRFPTGEIYFISKPVTGTSLFEVSCDGLKISNTCKVAPIQSDTSFFEKIFKVGSNIKESLVGALLFSLGFGE